MAVAALEPRANPDLRGQDAALSVLRAALASGRLAHGWLLSGPPGIGKATLAYRFARALLARPETTDPTLAMDPADPVFRQVAQGSHPDLRVIEALRDPKTGKVKSEITVDLVRAATASLNTTAALGGRRIVVIDGAETLNRNAANALLKSLEEPPPDAVLMLISHRPSRVAPTLRSRCAKLPLARLPDREVVEALARDSRRVLPVSTLQQGLYGVRDVCLSVPTVVGCGGCRQQVELSLTSKEKLGIQRSAQVLREIIDQVEVRVGKVRAEVEPPAAQGNAAPRGAGAGRAIPRSAWQRA
jgi:DNA polymerase III delta' subunit